MSAPFQLFDTLDPAIEAALRASIERWGVIVPVVVDQRGRMIDGHHRKRIAADLGVECPEHVHEVVNAGEARDLALTLNADRRQLDPEYRREMVAHLRGEGHSTPAIAKALGTSQSTVDRDVQQATRAGNLPAPDRVRGRDGKSYPATRPAPAPDPDDDPMFVCEECNDLFSVDVVHCLHCDHHLSAPWDGDCKYCYQPPGGTLPLSAPIDPDDPDLADDDIANPFCDEPADDVDDEPEPPRPEWQPTKPDLGDGISHPARYSPELLSDFRNLLWTFLVEGQGLNEDIRVLDPFAGTGRIHDLMYDDEEGNSSPFVTVGIELEPEWANLHPDTQVGSALDLPFDPGAFDAIVTSPTYGNRLADSHDAADPERRRSYTHDLGRDLHADNSGTLHWRNGGSGSLDYRTFHEKAWDEAVLVLRPGGIFILNCCDHVRGGMVQPVTAWHCWVLGRMGLDYLTSSPVQTRKLRQGANGNLREQEQVHVFRKPS